MFVTVFKHEAPMVHHTLYSESISDYSVWFPSNTEADDGDLGDDNEDQEETGRRHRWTSKHI